MIHIKRSYEVIKKTLDLADTIEEGIIYIRQLGYEETLTMLRDLIEGITSIENALLPMNSDLPKNNVESLTALLKQDISKIEASYEQGKGMDLEKQIEKIILSTFKNWKEELERILRQYIVS